MAQVFTEGISWENPLFRAYAFYCCILVLKMMSMSLYIAIVRYIEKAYISPEDEIPYTGKVKLVDNIERIRMGHRNDMENIPIFFITSLVYILTNPSYSLAVTYFKIFTIARFIHMIIYTYIVIPQPARIISFQVGYWLTGYLAVQNAIYFWR